MLMPLDEVCYVRCQPDDNHSQMENLPGSTEISENYSYDTFTYTGTTTASTLTTMTMGTTTVTVRIVPTTILTTATSLTTDRAHIFDIFPTTFVNGPCLLVMYVIEDTETSIQKTTDTAIHLHY
ncbi:hypothetical protein K501DRAFT_268009 [Backusella circina FSU 941]|nr:hypothetical protein K501DRAFT_268009 [Backusella circina FSU 941]